MNQRVERGNPLFKWWTWQRVVLATIVVLVVLEVGTFTLNWTWTGFQDNNTVWDWLQLLLLPLALAIVPIWFAAEEKQQRIWLAQLKLVLLVTVLVFILLLVGTYAYHWIWTGFLDHGKLWDWLSLLVVPILVGALPIWYSIHQSQSANEADKQQHSQDAQGTKDQSQAVL
jgi:hypothetical protein